MQTRATWSEEDGWNASAPENGRVRPERGTRQHRSPAQGLDRRRQGSGKFVISPNFVRGSAEQLIGLDTESGSSDFKAAQISLTSVRPADAGSPGSVRRSICSVARSG